MSADILLDKQTKDYQALGAIRSRAGAQAPGFLSAKDTIKVSAKTKEPPWYWTVRQVVWEVGDFGRLLPDMVVNTKYFTYKCRFTKAVK